MVRKNTGKSPWRRLGGRYRQKAKKLVLEQLSSTSGPKAPFRLRFYNAEGERFFQIKFKKLISC